MFLFIGNKTTVRKIVAGFALFSASLLNEFSFPELKNNRDSDVKMKMTWLNYGQKLMTLVSGINTSPN